MANPDSDELREFVALYLAGVIRDSLQWFTSEGSRRYAERQPAWSLVLGFPAKQIENGPLVQAYKEVADLAARLGPSGLALDIFSLRKLKADPLVETAHRIIPTSRIELYPEIAAQLAGYVNSPYRAHGNLILVDVGAGTLDVSTVILHENREKDVVSFHFCEVGPLGALKLLETRMAALEDVKSGSVGIRLDEFQSGTIPTPENAASILGRPGHVALAYSEAFDTASRNFAVEAIRIAISCASRFRKRQCKKHENANFDPWPKQIRFFFTGGGSRLGFYRDQFTEGPFEQELSRYTTWEVTRAKRRLRQQGLRLEPLPTPPDLQGLPAELVIDFDRFSVAHGLSYGIENLMKITTSVDS